MACIVHIMGRPSKLTQVFSDRQIPVQVFFNVASGLMKIKHQHLNYLPGLLPTKAGAANCSVLVPIRFSIWNKSKQNTCKSCFSFQFLDHLNAELNIEFQMEMQ